MKGIQPLRNIAIIAHVDHGKTTLVDAILKQTGVFRPGETVTERVLDSNPLERERGITILAKNTAVFYTPSGGGPAHKINIVDTPGHADFGGEVERILSMVDGALLVVDAAEGPLPQTRYVLSKALAAGLSPVVVINKIDRHDARPYQVVDEVLELFISLGATDDQLDFPVLYAAARYGIAHPSLDIAMSFLTKSGGSIYPLLDCIVEHVPPPRALTEHAAEEPLQFMVTMLDYDDYVGRIAIGRVHRGTLRQGAMVAYGRPEAPVKRGKIAVLYTFERLTRLAVEEVRPGEIAAVTGIEDIEIGETISDSLAPSFLPPLKVDEPTLTVVIRVNDSPLAGQDGEFLTSRHLRERLMKEARTNVALTVSETESPDAFLVAGRGELHLGVLIETMRRDGYEFAVSRPQVITKVIDGVVHEPMELVTVDVPQEYLGVTIEELGTRKGEMVDLAHLDGESVRVQFIVPARGLIGFHSKFLTETKGYGVLHHTFHGYAPYRGEIPSRTHGSLIAWESGVVTAYACESAQERGRLFVSPGDVVYAGMVVGAHNRPSDLEINVCKKKHMTNMRSSTAEMAVKLDPPVSFTVEQALAYIASDELVEVTPRHIRLRKAILDRNLRSAQKKRDMLYS